MDLKERIKKYRNKISLSRFVEYERSKGWKIPTGKQLKIGVPIFLGYFLFVYGTLYISDVLNTGEFNISKQVQIRKEREAEKKRLEDEKIEEKHADERRYKDLWKQLFAPYGLADKDSSTGIDFNEKVNAWRKMGYTERIFMVGEPFPEPNLDDLERAVQSYEKDR